VWRIAGWFLVLISRWKPCKVRSIPFDENLAPFVALQVIVGVTFVAVVRKWIETRSPDEC
jgi:hypothetical protein